MYSLLIADDEEIVRRGLAETFDWKSLGFFVSGIAKDGLEALDLLERDGADVVLADIRMPNLSGLDLATRIRVQFPETRVVILSGYDDFEFARRAIEQEVFSYLLKPLKEDRAVEVFKRLKHTLDGKRTDTANQQKSRIIRLRELLRSIIETGDGASEIPNFLERPYPGGVVMMLDPCPDGPGSFFQEQWHGILPRFLEELDTITEDLFVTSLRADRIALLLISPIADLPRNIDKVFLEIRRRGRELGDMSFTAAVGKPAVLPQDISESVSQACSLLGHALYLGKNRLIREELTREESALNLPDSRREAEHFTDIMSSRDEFSLIDRTDRIFTLMREACPRDTVVLKSWFRNFFYALEQVLHERGFAPEVILGNIDELIDSLSITRTIGDMRDLFYNQALSGLEATSKASNTSGHRLIRYTIDALQSRFSEDLGLEIIADEQEVSAPYLSRLFRSEMGVNFKEYLTRIRLDMARKLLRETDMRVYEVAAISGYPDQKYFSDIFKKRTGMTPREYRKEVRPPK